MGIRKEFERLDEIKRKLISVNFNESLNRYESKNPTLIECFETALWLNGAWYAFQEQQKKIDAHNKKLSIFIDELKKTHSNDKDNKMDYWRGFADCAEASVKVFYRDVGFAGED